MQFGVRRMFLGATAIAVTCLVGATGAAGQAGSAQSAPSTPGTAEKVPVSEEVFKTILVLKGLPVDNFFESMGMFANALGNDCTFCHSPKAYFDKGEFATQTPRMNRARQMIVMMNSINKQYFKGEPRVTCFTCHGGSESPRAEPNIMLQYGVPIEDPNIRQFPSDDSFSAAETFDKYIQALGGTARLAKFTSFAAKGSYSGFDTALGKIAVEMYGRSQPNGAPQQETIIHMFNGDSYRTFDGKSGWMAGPDTPMPLVPLTEGNLDRAKLEAMIPFPTDMKNTFPEWRTARTAIDDKEVRVVQGIRDGQVWANFYFDQSGLLVRIVRWTRTPVGFIPTHIDVSDYREVAGVKFPFKKIVTQTYMQMTIELSDVQANVTLPGSRFAKPAPVIRKPSA